MTEIAASRDEDRANAVATLRSVTDRYHRLDIAIKAGFVLLHPCETRPDEGPVGTVYVHLGRLTDGKIDPALPDALIWLRRLIPDKLPSGRANLIFQ